MENNSPTLNDYLGTAGNIATGVVGALNKPKTVKQSSATNWGLIAAIGGGVLVLLIAGMAFMGRK